MANSFAFYRPSESLHSFVLKVSSSSLGKLSSRLSVALPAPTPQPSPASLANTYHKILGRICFKNTEEDGETRVDGGIGICHSLPRSPNRGGHHTRKNQNQKKQKTARPWTKNPFYIYFLYIQSVFIPLFFFVIPSYRN